MNREIDERLGVGFDLNGQPVSSSRALTARLSDVLRDDIGARDVKVGCNAGDCGACTVLVDGAPVCACITAVGQVAGRQVDTLTGLMDRDPLAQRLALAFESFGAVQCGICTPGMLVTATALLRRCPAPTEAQACDALGGVLCRCTGYRKIIDAVLACAGAVGRAPTCRASTPAVPGQSEPSQAATVHAGTDAASHLAESMVVGQAMPRVDGTDKAHGVERFGDDLAPSDALVLKVVRSPHHHARFTLGDIDAFVATRPGLARVFAAADVPGLNRFGVIPPFIDQPVFAEHRVRFRGEAIAAVVGTATAVEGVSLDDFPVTWSPIPALLTPTDALDDQAAHVHEHGEDNVMCRGQVQRGDVDAALAVADHVVSASFETRFVEHAYIEPEAGYCERIDDRLEVHGCTQAPYMNREALADILDVPATSVRVVPSAVGGGFGSKLDLSWQPFVALAAWHLERAVRITYTRTESMCSTTKRHPASLQARIGASADGTVTAMHFDAVFNTGAYASWGPTVANRVPIHASGPYQVPHYRASTRAVYTHCVPAGAFRGFGVPQAAIAQESLYDELAVDLGMDRLAFRLHNALDDHQPTVTGQVFGRGVGIRACLQALSTRWHEALSTAADVNRQAQASGSSLRRGVGVASGWYGCGNTSLPNPSTIKAGISAAGDVLLHQGAVDIGQGSNTVLSQIFASSLGVSPSRLQLIGADTDLTPDAGKTSASRQTFVSGSAAHRCALALREEVRRLTNCRHLVSIDLRDGLLLVNEGQEEARTIELAAMPVNASGYVVSAEASYDPPTAALDDDGQGVPYAQFGYAAQMVELSVDTGLGTVELHAVVAAHDVGRAINPLLVEGQIQGGVTQGIGLALMEEFQPGRTENLHDYLIPTFGDVPPIESIIVEVPDEHGPYGAKGLGEHVLIPTAPAILNAISDACGARLREVPATPARVLEAIDSAAAAGARR